LAWPLYTLLGAPRGRQGEILEVAGQAGPWPLATGSLPARLSPSPTLAPTPAHRGPAGPDRRPPPWPPPDTTPTPASASPPPAPAGAPAPRRPAPSCPNPPPAPPGPAAPAAAPPDTATAAPAGRPAC